MISKIMPKVIFCAAFSFIFFCIFLCILANKYDKDIFSDDYARITDVEYKAVVIDEPGGNGKIHVTERLTFDVHAAEKDNLFWELWRDLPEDYIDDAHVHYDVLSVKQILDDGTEVIYDESPKLYWDDYDYVNSNEQYGPGKWFHSPGPYNEDSQDYECVLFYVDGLYREEVVFEIEYEMYNAALRYRDCSDLYISLYSEETINYLESYKAEILFPNDIMPSRGNYTVTTYGTDNENFPVTESATVNPGYYTFSIDLDEDDLKFSSYNEYIEFDLVAFGDDKHIFTEYAYRNYYYNDYALDEIFAEQEEYFSDVEMGKTIKTILLPISIVISIIILLYAFSTKKRMHSKHMFYEPSQKLPYSHEIPSDLDPKFAADLVFCKQKAPKDISGVYSAILLSLARKRYIELIEESPNVVRINILKKTPKFIVPTNTFGPYSGFDSYNGYDQSSSFDSYNSYDQSSSFDSYNSYDQNNSFGSYNSYDQNNSFGSYDSYDQNNSFGSYNSYDQNNSYSSYNTYTQNTNYNPSNGYLTNNSYGTNNGYNTNNGYAVNNGYNTNNGYAVNNSYNTNNGYAVNNSYNINDGYATNNGYSTNNAYFTNNGYGTNSTYDTNNTFEQNNSFGSYVSPEPDVTYEPLTYCEEAYFNLIVRHAENDTITMGVLEARISYDYENTSVFLDKINNSSVEIGIRNGYFQKADYLEPKNQIYSASKTFSSLGFFALLINIFTFSTRIELAFGAFFILGISSLISSFYLKKQTNKYILLTQLGEDEYEKWRAFYNYLNSDLSLQNSSIDDLPTLERYLIYATAFGISDKVSNALRVNISPSLPSLSESILYNPNYGSIDFGRLLRSLARFHRHRGFGGGRSGGGFGFGGGGRGGCGGGGGH